MQGLVLFAQDVYKRQFQHFKDYEKLMEKQLEAAGRKSDPVSYTHLDVYKRQVNCCSSINASYRTLYLNWEGTQFS